MKSQRERAAERGRLKARGVLFRLKIRAPDEIDVEAIAAHHNLLVKYGGLNGADGRLVSNGKAGTIRIADGISDERRVRFIIAHECGHHLIHVPKNEVTICTEGDLLKYQGGNTESEANFFASELLMPKKLFQPRCDTDDPSFALVKSLARDFATSLTATAIQFVELCPEACALVWSEAGRVKWSVRGPDFRYWIAPRTRLGNATLAYDVFNTGAVARERREEVPLSSWVDDADGEDVVEHTLAFFGRRAALSLLWLRA